MSQQQSQLDLEIVRRFSQAARARKAPAEPQEDVVDYDWTAPFHFTRDQKASLAEFAAGLSAAISQALSNLLHANIQTDVDSVTEHYAGKLRPTEQQSSDFCVGLRDRSGRSSGFIALPAEKAFAWVAQLLGGQGSASDTDREMSSLEGAILLDIFSALSDVLSQSLATAGGLALGCDKELSRGPVGLGESDAEEYCKITFQDPEVQDQPSIYVVIISDSLDAVVGGSGRAKGISADDVRKNVLERIKHVPIMAQARLETMPLKVRDITELQPGDVLLTQNKVDEPIDVVVQGRKVLSAFVVTSEGRYALQVAYTVKD